VVDALHTMQTVVQLLRGSPQVELLKRTFDHLAAVIASSALAPFKAMVPVPAPNEVVPGQMFKQIVEG
jgi:hypothetical protein